jgi:hypothetical protein
LVGDRRGDLVNEGKYPDEEKLEQIGRLFEFLKDPEGRQAFRADPARAVPDIDPNLLEVFGKLDEHHLLLVSELNESLYEAGYGVSSGVRMSMV